MKKLFTLVFAACMALVAHAQTDTTVAVTDDAGNTTNDTVIKYWSWKGNTGLNLNQVALVNWAAGGQSAFGANALINFESKYEKNKFSWTTLTNLAYGVQKSGKQDFRKAEDIIDFTSTLGLEATERWKYSLLKNFKSQFAPGYEFPDGTDSNRVLLSQFMAPAFVTVALGMEYEAPKYFKLFLSPLTSKTYIVLDTANIDQTRFGIDADKRVFQNLGAYLRANFEAEIFKNVTYNTELELFSNYLENPQFIDVNWRNKLLLKVNDWLNVTIVTDLIYDYDVLVPKEQDDGTIINERGVQFRQNLAIGLSYKFASKSAE